jgi:hypothetical protein
MPVVEKIYKVAAGELKIKITYFSTANGVLDFGVINIGELEYGYEDEDQLTFFPNVFRMEFTDFERKNYDILKYSLDNYPAQKFEDTGRVEVFLNGSTYAIYDGYIDQETLTYDEEKRVTSFEAVDFILNLKNITTFNMRSDPLGYPYPGGLPPKLETVPYVLWRIYKNIYPDLPEPMPLPPPLFEQGITNQITKFNKKDYMGIYWKHNWKFTGHNNYTVPGGFSYNSTSADWSTDYFKPVFAFFKYFWEERYEMYTLADLIKQLSKEFGAVIGSTGKNKVFFIKRFPDYGGIKEPLDGAIIAGSLIKTLYLKKITAVKNNNELFGPTKSFVFPENPNRPGYPKNNDDYMEIKTYFGTQPSGALDLTDGWQTSIRLTHTDDNIYKVGKTITDPDFDYIDNPAPWTLQNLTTEYVYRSRQKSRDKYEMELNGIEYDLFKSYSILGPLNSVKALRPMVIKKIF